MERPDPVDARRLFALFAALLAVSLLLHQLWWNGFEVASWRGLAALAALAVLARPGSVGRFLLLLAAEVVSVAADMPAVHSHTLLIALLGASVLAYAGARAVRGRRLADGGALFGGMAPFLRAQVVVVYVLAAVAKLNGDFLDPVRSCAAALSSQIAWFDPSLLDGAWRVVPSIWGTLLVELSLPLLLAVPRTRIAGLFLGGGFHLVLALAGNVPFSALMLALYVAFLPPDLPGRLVARLPWPAWRPPAIALPLVVGAWVALSLGDPAALREVILTGTRLLVVAAVITGGALLWLGARGAARSGTLRPRHPAFVVGLALILANGLSPYLGLKTESSFAMFSNLRTEPGYWNHAFIPEAVRVFGYQDELVAAGGGGGTRLVRFEADRRARLRDGTPTALDRVMKFRTVRPPERGC